jgi:hypothetical protein
MAIRSNLDVPRHDDPALSRPAQRSIPTMVDQHDGGHPALLDTLTPEDRRRFDAQMMAWRAGVEFTTAAAAHRFLGTDLTHFREAWDAARDHYEKVRNLR